MNHEAKNPKLHSLEDSSDQLGKISVWTLRKHVFRGTVAVTRIGRRVFLASEEIERIRREGLPSLRSGANRNAINERDSIAGEEKIYLTK
jgi:hypothetical protein